MQAANDVEAGGGGFFNDLPPAVRYDAADGGHADDQAGRVSSLRSFYIKVRNTQVNRTTGKTQLTRDQIATPLDNTEASLGIQWILNITNQYQVRRAEFDDSSCTHGFGWLLSS